MRKLLTLILFGLASVAPAQENVSHLTVFSAFDLDGEAADANQIVEATAMVDNGTSAGGADYTIVANPDVCRLVDTTIVDTNLNVGTLTVTGTGCLDEARVCSFAFTVGDDTGVKTLTCTDGQGAYFKTVTLVTTDTMTGESDETFELGYTSNSANGWAMYGSRTANGPNGERRIDPTKWTDVTKRITTSGSASTTVTGVTGADDAFVGLSVGDLMQVVTGNTVYELRVVTYTSADSIVVNKLVNIPAAGVTYRYKNRFFSTNPYDQLWIPVNAWESVGFTYSVDANANTGGVVATLECIDGNSPDFPLNPWVQIDTLTTNSGSTQSPTMTDLGPVILSEAPFSYCRFALKFGTGDDADAAAEDINLSVSLRK